jgi:Mn-dependent DtxR family transcriptional regulator
VHVANRTFIHFFEEVLGVSEEQAHIDSCKIEHLVSQETREKLLAFVQFFRTHGEFATKFREEFASYQFHCPGPDNCKMCETDHCDLSCVSPCDKHDHD